MLKKLLHILEYLLVSFFLLLIRVLPSALIRNLAKGCGALFYYSSPKRRSIAIENILLAKITIDPKEAARIARASFEHFAILSVETLQTHNIFSNLEAHITLNVPEATQKLLANSPKGFIGTSGHLGNWEVNLQLMGQYTPVLAIVRKMNNPYVQKLIEKKEMRGKVTSILRHDPKLGRKLIKQLRSGSAIGIMFDQHARNNGIWVDFMGRPAATHTSPAIFHLMTGAPIVFATTVRTGPMTFETNSSEPLIFEKTNDKEGDIRRITEKLNSLLEEHIRAYPEQYLWAHRRWRTPPAEGKVGK